MTVRALLVLLGFTLIPAAAWADTPEVHPPEAPRPLFIGLGAAAMVPFGNWAQNAGAGTGNYPAALPDSAGGGAGRPPLAPPPARRRGPPRGRGRGKGGPEPQAGRAYAKRRGVAPFAAAPRLYSVAAAGTVDIPGRTGRYSV